MKQEVQRALEMLDSAVMANDVWQAKRITNIILTEIEKMDALEIPENPTDREITHYLKQLKEEISILNRLKIENGSGAEIGDISAQRDDSSEDLSVVSSASKLRNKVPIKPKNFSRKFRVTERSFYE